MGQSQAARFSLVPPRIRTKDSRLASRSNHDLSRPSTTVTHGFSGSARWDQHRCARSEHDQKAYCESDNMGPIPEAGSRVPYAEGVRDEQRATHVDQWSGSLHHGSSRANERAAYKEQQSEGEQRADYAQLLADVADLPRGWPRDDVEYTAAED